MLVVAAPAKLNLSLEVVGRRPDGFHDLDSIVAPLDWHDLVGVSLRPAATTVVELRLSGAAALGVPDSNDNLAARAGLALAGLSGLPLRVGIWVDKRLPPAAGLGGGSADAGAVLRCGAELLRGMGRPLPEAALIELAATLGSDVAATLRPGWLRLRGRGELLSPIPGRRLELAVALAGASPTPQVFAALRPEERRGDGRSGRLEARLRAGDELIPAELGSALEAPAVRASEPLRGALERLRLATPATPWHLTGSGGAAFAIAGGRAEAVRLAALASGLGLPAWACRTLSTGLP